MVKGFCNRFFFLFDPLWKLKNLQPKAENYFSASGCTFPALGCTFPALGWTFSALGCTFPALGCNFKFFHLFLNYMSLLRNRQIKCQEK